MISIVLHVGVPRAQIGQPFSSLPMDHPRKWPTLSENFISIPDVMLLRKYGPHSWEPVLCAISRAAASLSLESRSMMPKYGCRLHSPQRSPTSRGSTISPERSLENESRRQASILSWSQTMDGNVISITVDLSPRNSRSWRPTSRMMSTSTSGLYSDQRNGSPSSPIGSANSRRATMPARTDGADESPRISMVSPGSVSPMKTDHRRERSTRRRAARSSGAVKIRAETASEEPGLPVETDRGFPSSESWKSFNPVSVIPSVSGSERSAEKHFRAP